MLRVRRPKAAETVGADVTEARIHYDKRHNRGNGNGHVPQVENNDVIAVECVDQTDDNSLRSTTDEQYNIRDLLETDDQTPSSSSSAAEAAAAAEQSISSAERLLASINDLLETKLRTDAQLREQTAKNQQTKNEWLIAAAVIDRLCFIVFGLCFLIGTSVLFLLATFVDN